MDIEAKHDEKMAYEIDVEMVDTGAAHDETSPFSRFA